MFERLRTPLFLVVAFGIGAGCANRPSAMSAASQTATETKRSETVSSERHDFIQAREAALRQVESELRRLYESSRESTYVSAATRAEWDRELRYLRYKRRQLMSDLAFARNTSQEAWVEARQAMREAQANREARMANGLCSLNVRDATAFVEPSERRVALVVFTGHPAGLRELRERAEHFAEVREMRYDDEVEKTLPVRVRLTAIPHGVRMAFLPERPEQRAVLESVLADYASALGDLPCPTLPSEPEAAYPADPTP